MLGSDWMWETLPKDELRLAPEHASSQVEIELHMFSHLLRRPRILKAGAAEDEMDVNWSWISRKFETGSGLVVSDPLYELDVELYVHTYPDTYGIAP